MGFEEKSKDDIRAEIDKRLREEGFDPELPVIKAHIDGFEEWQQTTLEQIQAIMMSVPWIDVNVTITRDEDLVNFNEGFNDDSSG